ncbi:MAG: AMP-dependent synthetase [Sphingomonas sanxanigenens]|uniref:AMP-dependent synthetase n=1 Tax=Sphingomonas sanxanigenens TaxID=397260 RepID=A0A2W5A6X5_9SPHN|nr:MAG: AMP-dependent synthetase [Sphingomonas sanxanigenens]
MPTALDLKIEAIINHLTGPSGPLATGSIEKDGLSWPVIAAAPPALPQYFAHFCAQHGDATFLVDGDERLSFAETYALARKVAGALVEGWKLRPGEHVGIAMRNAPTWIIAYMGVVMAGGVATLFNGWWQGEELVEGIRDSDTRLLIADLPRVRRIAESGEAITAEIVAVDLDLSTEAALAPIFVNGGSSETELPQIGPDDDATILFTSGSTGRSKGAISDHRAIMQAIFNYLAYSLMGLQLLTEEGKLTGLQPSTLLNVPLFHVTAEIPVMLQSFAMGRKLVMMPKWDAREAMRLIEKEKITYFVGVPLMSFEILTHPDRARFDLSSCKDFAAGGAPRPVEHVRRLSEEMGDSKPLIGYGLTETNAVGCGNFRENYLAKPNSTGRASLPLVDLAILDDAGKPVAQGERGEVCIRSICNFKGYWNNPEATAAAYTADRYFRTGDIGYLDEDDYLFIVDRKKDIIIRGGENISCQEVEDALYEHPGVAEAAVFGLADERFGEVPGAVVHPADGAALNPIELCEFLSKHIAAFKIPQRIWIAPDPLPRLGTEKIDKVGLRARFRALAAKEAA